MREEEVLQCQFQSWYPSFRSLSFRSEIVSLPEAFVSYLLEDGIFLLSHSEALPSKPRQEQWEAHTDDYKVLRDEEDTSAEPEVPIFADLCDQLRAAIHRLGGAVVPKLNWSCPKDTTWISPSGSLKCTNPDEVILLLKSSDTLVHDLCHAFEACEDASRERPDEVVLVLRKWYDLHPEMEFSLAGHGHVAGISQRDVASHYPVLIQKRAILRAILLQFFEEHIKDKFACKSYVFDVYVTRNEQVKLVDFNTYGGVTLPLLYTWEELNDLAVQADGRMKDTRCSLESGQANGVHISQDVGLGDKEGTEQADAVRQQLGTMSLHVAPQLEQVGSHAVGLEESANVWTSRTDVVDIELRVVESYTGMQPSMRLASGVPRDLVNFGPGSPLDDFIQHADREAQLQENGPLAARSSRGAGILATGGWSVVPRDEFSGLFSGAAAVSAAAIDIDVGNQKQRVAAAAGLAELLWAKAACTLAWRVAGQRSVSEGGQAGLPCASANPVNVCAAVAGCLPNTCCRQLAAEGLGSVGSSPEEGLCLQLEQVRKAFGKRIVVDNVSITVRQGEVVGLLGPNGAGKSTVFAMMVGQEVPSDGGVRLGAEDITQLPLESRARLGIGYLTQEPSIFKGLSVHDNILLVLQESGLSKDARTSRLQELLQGFRLEHVKDTLGRELSGGERRRTELARALAVNCSGKPPRILLVDEPFAGVDPIGVSEIQGLLRHLRDEMNIGILTTDHNVNETLRICDRAYMIYQGKVIAAGTPDALYGDPFVRTHYLGESFPRV
eukprot:SM000011S19174  [mRNA]  locus=s11:1265180:1270983:- [translate_table: standard]